MPARMPQRLAMCTRLSLCETSVSPRHFHPMRGTPASARLPYSARVATIPSRRRSVSERVESGRAARQQTPRGALAEHLVVPTRPDPVELLHESDSSRDAELLPLKYERMSASPFAFFRGFA